MIYIKGKRTFINNYFDYSLHGPYIEWINDPKYDTSCNPRIKENTYLPDGIGAYLKCATFPLYNERMTSSVINTIGYHHFIISFNIVISAGREGDYCRLDYSTNGGINYGNIISFKGNEFNTGYKYVSINTEVISNIELVKLRFEFQMVWPATPGCYINNLTMIGFEITDNPTFASIAPTMNPTMLSDMPTTNIPTTTTTTNIPTFVPSNIPSNTPSNIPSNIPTWLTTIYPTNIPTYKVNNMTLSPTIVTTTMEEPASINNTYAAVIVISVSIIVIASIILLFICYVKQRQRHAINNGNIVEYNAMDPNNLNPDP